MNKSTILDYVRSRLYMMGSNAAPSFTDESLYPFLDRAHQFVIQNAVEKGRLDLISDLIKTADSSVFTAADFLDGNTLWVSNNTTIKAEFFLYVTGYAKITNTSGVIGSSYEKIPLEVVSIQFFDLIKDKSSRMRFPKPKVFFGYANEFMSVLIDEMSTFEGTPAECVEIKYVVNPQLFSQMDGGDSPKIAPQLHLDIVEKTAELVSTVLQPRSAAQQVQNNDLIGR